MEELKRLEILQAKIQLLIIIEKSDLSDLTKLKLNHLVLEGVNSAHQDNDEEGDDDLENLLQIMSTSDDQ